MFQIKCVILIVIMMQIRAESRTVNSKFKFSKMIVRSREAVVSERPKSCSELPAPVLNDILGAAFNSRFVRWNVKHSKFSILRNFSKKIY